jgi:Zn-dependent protease with chaperone function
VTASLALATYALVVATLGAHLLRRARWPERAPRLGVMTWQVLSGSVVVAVMLAGLALAIPVSPFTLGLAEFLETCVMLLRAQYATPGGSVTATLGLLVATLVAGRITYCITKTVWTARAGRARQRRQLMLVARKDPRLGATVIDSSHCAAYCVPGRSARVVLSSTTLAALDEDQIAAVVAHERAHLAARHHLVIEAAAALHAAFPFVPAFAWGAEQLGRLTEMLADDAAARHHDRLTLATALVRLAEANAPVGTLAAGGSTAVARVRRLAAPARPLSKARGAVAVLAICLLAAAPLALSAAPAAAVRSADYCPVSLHQA